MQLLSRGNWESCRENYGWIENPGMRSKGPKSWQERQFCSSFYFVALNFCAAPSLDLFQEAEGGERKIATDLVSS
jgi:hypothetical protein